MVTSQTRTTTCRLEDTVIHMRDLITISLWITLTRLAMTSTMVTPPCNLSPIPLPVGAPGTTLICEKRQSPSPRTWNIVTLGAGFGTFIFCHLSLSQPAYVTRLREQVKLVHARLTNPCRSVKSSQEATLIVLQVRYLPCGCKSWQLARFSHFKRVFCIYVQGLSWDLRMLNETFVETSKSFPLKFFVSQFSFNCEKFEKWNISTAKVIVSLCTLRGKLWDVLFLAPCVM